MESNSGSIANAQTALSGVVLFVLFLGVLAVSKWFKRSRAQSRLRLPGDEVSGALGSDLRTRNTLLSVVLNIKTDRLS
jgi:hypothetical protein